MDSLRKTALAAGVALTMAGGAEAADMGDTFLEPLMPVEIGSNWYLRGDIAYRLMETPKVTPLATAGIATGETIDDTWSVGAGAGYRFSPWFRMDATVDFGFPASGGYSYAGPIPDPLLVFAPALGTGVTTFDITAWTVLANAYVDLGTWSGITPYIGAGIGGAWIKSGSMWSVYTPTPPVPGFPAFGTGEPEGKDWNLAWALMAGFSFDITPNWILDIGYRYLSLGDVTVNTHIGPVTISDIAAQEARIGMRFVID